MRAGSPSGLFVRAVVADVQRPTGLDPELAQRSENPVGRRFESGVDDDGEAVADACFDEQSLQAEIPVGHDRKGESERV